MVISDIEKNILDFLNNVKGSVEVRSLFIKKKNKKKTKESNKFIYILKIIGKVFFVIIREIFVAVLCAIILEKRRKLPNNRFESLEQVFNSFIFIFIPWSIDINLPTSYGALTFNIKYPPGSGGLIISLLNSESLNLPSIDNIANFFDKESFFYRFPDSFKSIGAPVIETLSFKIPFSFKHIDELSFKISGSNSWGIIKESVEIEKVSLEMTIKYPGTDKQSVKGIVTGKLEIENNNVTVYGNFPIDDQGFYLNIDINEINDSDSILNEDIYNLCPFIPKDISISVKEFYFHFNKDLNRLLDIKKSIVIDSNPLQIYKWELIKGCQVDAYIENPLSDTRLFKAEVRGSILNGGGNIPIVLKVGYSKYWEVCLESKRKKIIFNDLSLLLDRLSEKLPFTLTGLTEFKLLELKGQFSPLFKDVHSFNAAVSGVNRVQVSFAGLGIQIFILYINKDSFSSPYSFTIDGGVILGRTLIPVNIIIPGDNKDIILDLKPKKTLPFNIIYNIGGILKKINIKDSIPDQLSDRFSSIDVNYIKITFPPTLDKISSMAFSVTSNSKLGSGSLSIYKPELRLKAGEQVEGEMTGLFKFSHLQTEIAATFPIKDNILKFQVRNNKSLTSNNIVNLLNPLLGNISYAQDLKTLDVINTEIRDLEINYDVLKNRFEECFFSLNFNKRIPIFNDKLFLELTRLDQTLGRKNSAKLYLKIVIDDIELEGIQSLPLEDGKWIFKTYSDQCSPEILNRLTKVLGQDLFKPLLPYISMDDIKIERTGLSYTKKEGEYEGWELELGLKGAIFNLNLPYDVLDKERTGKTLDFSLEIIDLCITKLNQNEEIRSKARIKLPLLDEEIEGFLSFSKDNIKFVFENYCKTFTHGINLFGNKIDLETDLSNPSFYFDNNGFGCSVECNTLIKGINLPPVFKDIFDNNIKYKISYNPESGFNIRLTKLPIKEEFSSSKDNNFIVNISGFTTIAIENAEFSYDFVNNSFNTSGKLVFIEPLGIPLSLIKSILKTAGLGFLADNIPDKAPAIQIEEGFNYSVAVYNNGFWADFKPVSKESFSITYSGLDLSARYLGFGDLGGISAVNFEGNLALNYLKLLKLDALNIPKLLPGIPGESTIEIDIKKFLGVIVGGNFIPLFFDKLGLVYKGVEGLKANLGLSFKPVPGMEYSVLSSLFHELKEWITGKSSSINVNLLNSIGLNIEDINIDLPSYLGKIPLVIEGCELSDNKQVECFLNLLKSSVKEPVKIGSLLSLIPVENRSGSEGVLFGPVKTGSKWVLDEDKLTLGGTWRIPQMVTASATFNLMCSELIKYYLNINISGNFGNGVIGFSINGDYNLDFKNSDNIFSEELLCSISLFNSSIASCKCIIKENMFLLSGTCTPIALPFITATGNLQGKIRNSGNFYLEGAGDIKLNNNSVSNGFISISNNGYRLQGEWFGIKLSLDTIINGSSLTLTGKSQYLLKLPTISIPLKVPKPGGGILDIGTLKLNYSVGLIFIFNISENGSSVGVSGKFNFNGMLLGFNFEIPGLFKSINDLSGHLIRNIRSIILANVFSPNVTHSIDALFKLLRTGVLSLSNDIGTVLNKGFSQSSEQVVSLLKSGGYSSASIAKSLKSINMDYRSIASLMHLKGYSATDVINSLKSIGDGNPGAALRNIYPDKQINDVLPNYSVYSVYSKYSVYSVYAKYSVYSKYSVHSKYSVYSVHSAGW